jgi:hypothetical protein
MYRKGITYASITNPIINSFIILISLFFTCLLRPQIRFVSYNSIYYLYIPIRLLYPTGLEDNAQRSSLFVGMLHATSLHVTPSIHIHKTFNNRRPTFTLTHRKFCFVIN